MRMQSGSRNWSGRWDDGEVDIVASHVQEPFARRGRSGLVRVKDYMDQPAGELARLSVVALLVDTGSF
jgi:uncharacterized protein (DUF1684 family)